MEFDQLGFNREFRRLRLAGPAAHQGIECDGGWQELVFELVSDLQGLYDIADRELVIRQLKAIDGQLECYLDPMEGALVKAARESIQVAQETASITCEQCGKIQMTLATASGTACDDCHHDRPKDLFQGSTGGAL